MIKFRYMIYILLVIYGLCYSYSTPDTGVEYTIEDLSNITSAVTLIDTGTDTANYELSDNLIVSYNDTIIFDSGTILKIKKYNNFISVLGTLKIAGANSNQNYIYADTQWNGIVIYDSGILIIDHTTIDSAINAVKIYDGSHPDSVSITNSTFRYHHEEVIYIDEEGYKNFYIYNDTFIYNDSHIIKTRINSIPECNGTIVTSNNSSNKIKLLSGTVLSEVTFGNVINEYYFDDINYLTINSGNTVTIDAGVIITSNRTDFGIINKGNLYVSGTANDTVQFITNKLKWDGISCETGSITVLDYCYFDSTYNTISISDNHVPDSITITNTIFNNVVNVPFFITVDNIYDNMFLKNDTFINLSNEFIQTSISSIPVFNGSISVFPTSYKFISIISGGCDKNITVHNHYVERYDIDTSLRIVIDTDAAVSVDSGVTFNILNSNSYFDVYGSLTLNGTVSDSIMFTSNNLWGGFRLYTGSTIYFDNAIIDSAINAFEISAGNNPDSIIITNSSIRYSDEIAISIKSDNLADSISLSNIEFNQNNKIIVSHVSSVPLMESVSLNNNVYSHIELISGNISNRVTYNNGISDYMVSDSDIVILSTGQLTLSPGIRLKLKNAGIQNYGNIISGTINADSSVRIMSSDSNTFNGIFLGNNSSSILYNTHIDSVTNNNPAIRNISYVTNIDTLILVQCNIRSIEETAAIYLSYVPDFIEVVNTQFSEISNFCIQIDSYINLPEMNINNDTFILCDSSPVSMPIRLISFFQNSSFYYDNTTPQYLCFIGTVIDTNIYFTHSYIDTFLIKGFITIDTSNELVLNDKSILFYDNLSGIDCYGKIVTNTSMSGFCFLDAYNTKWRGLELINNDSSVIEYLNIQNASIGLSCISANVDVRYCTIANAKIDGIRLENTSSTISYSFVSRNTNSGILTTNYDNTKIRNNIISGNKYGITITESANPDIGNVIFRDSGANIIQNNTSYNIRNLTDNIVKAEGNTFDDTDSISIDAKLYDDDENGAYGNIDFVYQTVISANNLNDTYIHYLDTTAVLSLTIDGDIYNDTFIDLVIKDNNGYESGIYDAITLWQDNNDNGNIDSTIDTNIASFEYVSGNLWQLSQPGFFNGKTHNVLVGITLKHLSTITYGDTISFTLFADSISMLVGDTGPESNIISTELRLLNAEPSVTVSTKNNNDNIYIIYTIVDLDNDTISLSVLYSYDSISWYDCTLTGDKDNITSTDYYGTLVWTTTSDIVDTEINDIYLKIIPSDITDTGSTVYNEIDNIDNYHNHSISIYPDNYYNSNNISINYNVTDISNDTLNIKIKYSIDSGSTYYTEFLSTISYDEYEDSIIFPVYNSVKDSVYQNRLYYSIILSDSYTEYTSSETDVYIDFHKPVIELTDYYETSDYIFIDTNAKIVYYTNNIDDTQFLKVTLSFSDTESGIADQSLNVFNNYVSLPDIQSTDNSTDLYLWINNATDTDEIPFIISDKSGNKTNNNVAIHLDNTVLNVSAIDVEPADWTDTNYFLLSWEKPEDTVGIKGYYVYYDTVLNNAVDVTGTYVYVTDTNVILYIENPAMYEIIIKAQDNLRNLSSNSIEYLYYDNTRPGNVTSISDGSDISDTFSIQLFWNSPESISPIVGYRIQLSTSIDNFDSYIVYDSTVNSNQTVGVITDKNCTFYYENYYYARIKGINKIGLESTEFSDPTDGILITIKGDTIIPTKPGVIQNIYYTNRDTFRIDIDTGSTDDNFKGYMIFVDTKTYETTVFPVVTQLLSNRLNYIYIRGKDYNNNMSDTLIIMVYHDNIVPQLNITSPDTDYINIKDNKFIVQGQCDTETILILNAETVSITYDRAGKFKYKADLSEGTNIIDITLYDSAFNINRDSVTIYYDPVVYKNQATKISFMSESGEDTRIDLIIPENSFQSDMKISVSYLSDNEIQQDNDKILYAVDFIIKGMDNQEYNSILLDKSVILKLYYDDDMVLEKEIESEQRLTLSYYDNVKWNDVNSSVDNTNKCISGSINHFSIYAVKKANRVSQKFTLDGVAPEPFTPNNDNVYDFVTFNIKNPQNELYKIKLFNIYGQRIRELDNMNIWDGKDNTGRLMKSGVYIYIIQSDDKKISGKVTLVR